MNNSRQSLALLSGAFGIVLAVLAIVGCGESTDRRVITSSEAAFVPVIESSDIHVGVPRLVLTLLERDKQPQFPEDAEFRIRYFDPTEDGIKFHSEAALREIDVEGLRYLIASNPPFAAAGQWALAVTVDLPDGTAESTPRLPFLVRGTARGLTAGDQAPRVDTPTISDGVLERMAEPGPEARDLYERSASELIARGEPFLIVWASAERCAGRRACARALEQAIEVLQQETLAVLHVEPFGRPRPQALQALIDEANEAWSIEAEPQFFLVDRDGLVAARFEIIVERAELEAAVERLVR
ncbi:MAG: hypothetical protein OXI41_01075 [Chloroflexota bacterium]|nr:hypothetical protein [Chloroflexota bacterium]MDE2896161.1 hypothetical protein [Chloroflexota bacterium]